MIDFIKNLFGPTSPEVMATNELEDAKRELLKAQSAMEYAKAIVTYRSDQIRRLNFYLGETQ
jgi:hypothetical protein